VGGPHEEHTIGEAHAEGGGNRDCPGTRAADSGDCLREWRQGVVERLHDHGPGNDDRDEPSTTPSPVSTATQLTGIPDYWIGESQRDFRLYREFRTVPHVAGGTVASAVSAMMRLKPLDPDYTSPWRPPSQLRVTQSGRAITVDLSTDAFANTQVGGELAERAVQQLVYTAIAAAHTAGHDATTVAVTVNGAQYDAWGVIGVGSPMRRPAMLDVQALAWVTSPQEGEARRAGMVAFTGYGASCEAIFAWKVTSSSGAVVARGSAIGGTGTGGFGDFTFSARLAEGSYTVQVATDDPSGGASGVGPAIDDKQFTVM
jgi:hypothetical protein